MLQQSPMYAYVPVKDLSRARKFYEGTLGFRPMEENNGGVMYQSGNGTAFFLYPSGGAGTNQASTAFWKVDNLDAEMSALRSKGVKFEDYDMPGVKTENGVAIGGGAKAAWFKDSEGNIMAVIQPMK
ncbi:MAG TPA: VOC family protein [Candidatus Kapabacteria bacterium]|jgi:catechol 2,3-dioxygenase-like lactoylglutathione lyase family enzyme|nr:VOC family protein [Candidatus Kapabacteria bacterium]